MSYGRSDDFTYSGYYMHIYHVSLPITYMVQIPSMAINNNRKLEFTTEYAKNGDDYRKKLRSQNRNKFDEFMYAIKILPRP